MTKSVRKKYWICFGLITGLILIDQILKIYIKLNFTLSEEVDLIGDWCKLHFIENEGMAFGMSFGENFGKLFLSLFRLVASIYVMYLLIKLIKKDSRMLFLISISFIFVGAVGNLIDSCFYGIVFSESTHSAVATAFPDGGGYGRFLYGRVVDMFYFPLFEWTWPSWVPWVGGEQGEFFNAIFNVADAIICIGVGLFLIDQFAELRKKKKEKEVESETEQEKIDSNSDENKDNHTSVETEKKE